MDVKQVKTSEIKVYAKNAKKHPEEQVKAIANSIKEFGFRQPLVLDKNMEIIVGHGRLAAAKLLGMTAVPVVMADDLTEEQVKAFRLADNKTNESDWNFETLKEELLSIEDLNMEDFGFSLDFSEDKEVNLDDFFDAGVVQKPAKENDSCKVTVTCYPERLSELETLLKDNDFNYEVKQ